VLRIVSADVFLDEMHAVTFFFWGTERHEASQVTWRLLRCRDTLNHCNSKTRHARCHSSFSILAHSMHLQQCSCYCPCLPAWTHWPHGNYQSACRMCILSGNKTLVMHRHGRRAIDVALGSTTRFPGPSVPVPAHTHTGPVRGGQLRLGLLCWSAFRRGPRQVVSSPSLLLLVVPI
jgi:hypothetical protein